MVDAFSCLDSAYQKPHELGRLNIPALQGLSHPPKHAGTVDASNASLSCDNRLALVHAFQHQMVPAGQERIRTLFAPAE